MCDLLPAEDRSNKHLVVDATTILDDGWDIVVVAHPPCTRLCNSGVRWLHTPPPGRTKEEMWSDLAEAADVFSTFWNAPVPRVAIENPIMHGHARKLIKGYRPPTQTIQPWQHGHGETKATSLWLRGLPALVPSDVVDGREARVHRLPQTADRWKERSRTFPGIARAMATQWGEYVLREVAA